MAIDDGTRDIEPMVAQSFAWKHFLAIVGGTILIIAVICTIATLTGKQEATFSASDLPHATAIA